MCSGSSSGEIEDYLFSEVTYMKHKSNRGKPSNSRDSTLFFEAITLRLNDFGAPISLVCGEKSKGGVALKEGRGGWLTGEKSQAPQNHWKCLEATPSSLFSRGGSIVARAINERRNLSAKSSRPFSVTADLRERQRPLLAFMDEQF